jgi:digeranylgeranylglycerophospholipid reductase
MRDIAVIGGGPSGLYAAHCLAARGFDVVLFEEHAVAGDPVHCTGVLAAEAFDEFAIPTASVLNPLQTARFYGPSGGAIEYSTRTAEALVIDRLQFDQTLASQAVASGAAIETGARVVDLVPHDAGVNVVCGDGVVHARAAVLASGANYSLHRRVGLGMPSLHLQSAQLEVPAGRLGTVEVHFGREIAPRGFAWIVPVVRPHGTFARVGLMCEGQTRDCFRRFFERVRERWVLDTSGSPETTARLKMLPLGPIDRTFTDRVIAVGDAAGLVKATTGGGIYYSLTSARLAADVLAAALGDRGVTEERLAEYERSWRAVLGEELEAQMTLRSIAGDLQDEDIDSLFELARTDGIMPIVNRTASFNRHRHLILSLLSHPPARRVLMRRVLGWGGTA